MRCAAPSGRRRAAARVVARVPRAARFVQTSRLPRNACSLHRLLLPRHARPEGGARRRAPVCSAGPAPFQHASSRYARAARDVLFHRVILFPAPRLWQRLLTATFFPQCAQAHRPPKVRHVGRGKRGVHHARLLVMNHMPPFSSLRSAGRLSIRARARAISRVQQRFATVV